MLVFVVAIVLMLSIDARLTLMALLPLPLVSVIVWYFGSAIHKRFEAIQEQLARPERGRPGSAGRRPRRPRLQPGGARNRAVPRGQPRIRPAQPRPDPAAGAVLSEHDAVPRASARCWCCGWAAGDVIRGRITLGEFVAFNAYLVMLSWPMIAFGWVTNILQRGMASWKRMLEVLDAVPDIDDRHVTDAGRRGAADRRDRDPRSRVHLSRTPIDRCSTASRCASRPGQTVALVGATGSGKSTLINLLPRLHEPPPGTVFLDGVDVREIPLDRLRGAIGFVPQEPFLFSDTIADNVALGVADVRRRTAAADCDASGCAKPRPSRGSTRTSMRFRKGYETLVGERGITLSGGQKQRTAIARAVMLESSHPDPGRRAVGGGHLHGRGDPGAAASVHAAAHVDHRLAPGLDRPPCRLIVVLDDGRIVEQGTTTSWSGSGGLYAELASETAAARRARGELSQCQTLQVKVARRFKSTRHH